MTALFMDSNSLLELQLRPLSYSQTYKPDPLNGEPSSGTPWAPLGAPPGPSDISAPSGTQPDPGNTELLIQNVVEVSMRLFVFGYTD